VDADSADDLTANGGNPLFSTHAYTLLDSAGGRFEIVGNRIRVADADNLEYNAPPALDDGIGHRYYGVVVHSQDGGVLFRDETIRIYVSQVAETAVTSIVIGDDTPTRHQRSRIDQLTVAFSRVIDLGLSNVPAAFTLTRLENNSNVSLTANWAANDNGTPSDPTDDFSVATLTFAAQTNVFGHSLIDGNYELHVDGSQLRDSRGIAIDADGDGAPGGSQNVRCYRLFGDFVTTGNYHEPGFPLSWRVVTGDDLSFFRQAFGALVGQSGYDAAFDYDGDGDIDGLDLAFFRINFGVFLPEI
jgi:hypothetical protein